MKRRIILLKQSYRSQLDEEKTWDQVEEIIKTLEKGETFLTFEDISSARSTANKKKAEEEGKEGEGEEKKKEFYEDATLGEDENKYREREAEKRRIEEALNPDSLDLASPEDGAEGANLTSVPVTADAIEEQEQEAEEK